MKHSISSVLVVLWLSLSLSWAPGAVAEPDVSNQAARLGEALAQYATALEEPDRDVRLALFARAEDGFDAVIQAGAKNAALYTNLGHAALQAEHIGRAVLAYHRALGFDPDAAAAQQNLVHIRGLFPSWVPRPKSVDEARPLLFYRQFSSTDRASLAALCFALAAASLAISVRRQEGAWRGIAILGGVAWALVVASIVFDSTEDRTRLAVLTADEVLARSADSRLAALAYPDPLPGGVEVEILEERAEWARIRLYNGRDVWVSRSTVTRVAGDS